MSKYFFSELFHLFKMIDTLSPQEPNEWRLSWHTFNRVIGKSVHSPNLWEVCSKSFSQHYQGQPQIRRSLDWNHPGSNPFVGKIFIRYVQEASNWAKLRATTQTKKPKTCFVTWCYKSVLELIVYLLRIEKYDDRICRKMQIKYS